MSHESRTFPEYEPGASLADRRVAVLTSYAIILGLCAQSMLSILTGASDSGASWIRVLHLLICPVAAFIYSWTQRHAIDGNPSRQVIVVDAVLSVACCIAFVAGSWGLMTFCVANILTIGRRGGVWKYIALSAGVLTAVEIVAVSVHSFGHWIDRIALIAVIELPALVLYVLTRLAITVEQLELSREHLARLEVEQERTRLSRDLHDIIGRGFVAVSLRLQTALRLLDRDMPKAQIQIEEAAKTVEQAQAGLRRISRGTVIVDFDSELETTRDLLERLHISLSAQVDVTARTEISDELFARVLRECVTNMLKHSRPSRVRINRASADGIDQLTIANDGARILLPDALSNGTGLEDQRHRLAAEGGTLRVRNTDRGWFEVTASLPTGENLYPHPVNAVSQGVEG